MARGAERIKLTTEALGRAGLDALVCTLPANVLLLSGYWPVVGTAAAIATADGGVRVLAPADEQELAEHGWASELRTYEPGSLQHLASPAEAIRPPLEAWLREAGLARGRIGYEDGNAYEPASYAAIYLFGEALRTLLERAAPEAQLAATRAVIAQLRSTLTPDEVAQVRAACAVAATAFAKGAAALRPGLHEPAAATAFSALLSEEGLAQPGVQRAGGFVFCMSGPNSALAGGAYARTRDRALRGGDFVLIHCNSFVDGYFTDITRTYCLGEPDARQRAMYEAVFAARAAALAALQPGARAAAVDGAARAVLTERGFGEAFTHGVGHNVGLTAISQAFPPRLHPASDDRMAVGMTFNIEPAIYLKGFGGLRHCDVVTLTADGPAVLTPFQADLASMVL